MRVIFGDYTPDQPPHLSNGLVEADGCVPVQNGYAPIGAFSPLANGTLSGACIGAGGYRVAGDVHLFAGTATDIYRYDATGYTSLVTGLSTTPANGLRFCPFGTLMLATNGTDAIQKFDPASPAAMADLSGDAPTARFLFVVRGILVAGYADDNALRVAWSDYADPADWTAGGSSLAGQADMDGGGDITGGVGGEYGLLFQQNRIMRMTQSSDDTIWQWDEIVTDAGCIAPNSLATFGKITFFLSNKGFMACDGVTVEAIGSEKVDRTFLAMLDRHYIDTMTAVVDPKNSLYIVSVPAANPANTVYIYNYALQRWTTARITTERMFSALALGVSLEELDDVYGSIDAIPVSLDSAEFSGGYPLLLLFDGTHTLGSLSGPNMPMRITDARKELVQGARARITAVRPLTDAPDTIVTVSGANALSDTPVVRSYSARTGAGVYRMRENWNLTQVTLQFPAGSPVSYVQGYDIDAVAGGRA